MNELSADLLAAILEQSADAIVFADPAGIIRVWNRAATTVFGFSADEALGRSLDLIIPDKLRTAHWSGFRRAMETGLLRLDGRPTMTRATHKLGTRLYVEMTFALVRSSDGAVAGSVAVARDATQRYEDERARRRATPG
ncbi:MAG TPA: PAS domain S-box protein [Casimicrobiaceae bacterium]|nr:PAS domain S-box protein [Casimicrobiaceae bacterium]